MVEIAKHGPNRPQTWPQNDPNNPSIKRLLLIVTHEFSVKIVPFQASRSKNIAEKAKTWP